MNPLRSVLLAAAANDNLRDLVATAPVSRGLVRRFVAGERTEQAVAAAAALVADGRAVTLDYLGEHAQDAALAERTVDAYLELLGRLADEGLAGPAEVSVKLSALGGSIDERLAAENAARICAAAQDAGTTVTLDMEDHASTDATLATLRELRERWPSTGAVLQACLRRTLDDCAALAGPGSRVRLCKGAYAEPATVAYSSRHEVDRSYLRCANVLLAGGGYPMFATHDPRLLRILHQRALWYGREAGELEYQMLYGVRPDEQRALAGEGHTVRVYLPYGTQWYGYLVRRLAERPANLALLGRALVSTK